MKKGIIIALIGAISAIVIALIANGLFNNKDETKYHFKITDIDIEKCIDIERKCIDIEGIRIFGKINRLLFSYPNSSFILEPKYFIPNQIFEIEDKNGFDCSFEVVILDKSCQFHYLRPYESFVINQDDFKYSGVYKVNLHENISNITNNDTTISLSCMIEFKIY